MIVVCLGIWISQSGFPFLLGFRGSVVGDGLCCQLNWRWKARRAYSRAGRVPRTAWQRPIHSLHLHGPSRRDTNIGCKPVPRRHRQNAQEFNPPSSPGFSFTGGQRNGLKDGAMDRIRVTSPTRYCICTASWAQGRLWPYRKRPEVTGWRYEGNQPGWGILVSQGLRRA